MPYIELAVTAGEAALFAEVAEGLCQFDISEVQDLALNMGTGPGAQGSCLSRVPAQITKARARLAGLHIGRIICPKK